MSTGAIRMSENSDSPQRRGGRARARSTTAEQRSEIARAGAAARWARANSIPQAEFGSSDTPLRVGEIELDCYVLNNSQRVISQRGVFRGLNVARGGPREDMRPDDGGAELPRFATQDWLLPFLPNDLLMALRNPILFSAPGIAKIYGYPATILTEICDAILAARAAGKTTPRQDAIVQRAELLVRAFAKVGIIALVDEATGYQQFRARDELQRILAAYISPELMPYTSRFPQNFYFELHRVRGWKYAPGSNKRNHYIGRLTNELIYKQLPPGVLDELRNKNPVVSEKRRRKHKHYQFLTEEIGDPHLGKQIDAITTLLSVSDNWSEFVRLFSKKFKPREPDLFSIPPPESDDGGDESA
jgi:P63C domain-containing protein